MGRGVPCQSFPALLVQPMLPLYQENVNELSGEIFFLSDIQTQRIILLRKKCVRKTSQKVLHGTIIIGIRSQEYLLRSINLSGCSLEKLSWFCQTIKMNIKLQFYWTREWERSKTHQIMQKGLPHQLLRLNKFPLAGVVWLSW